MSQEDDFTGPDIAASFARLSEAAINLNTVADGVSRVVTDVEFAFKKFNLGVSAWVETLRHAFNDGDFLIHEVGYDRIGTKWGLAVRTIEGHDYQDPDQWRYTPYPYHESPRRLRIGVVPKLPALLDELAKIANQTAKDLTHEIAYGQEFVSAMNDAAKAARARRAAEAEAEKRTALIAQAVTQAVNEKSKSLIGQAANRKARAEAVRKMSASEQFDALDALKKS